MILLAGWPRAQWCADTVSFPAFIENQKRQLVYLDEAVTKSVSQHSRGRNNDTDFVQNSISNALFTPPIHVVGHG